MTKLEDIKDPVVIGLVNQMKRLKESYRAKTTERVDRKTLTAGETRLNLLGEDEMVELAIELRPAMMESGVVEGTTQALMAEFLLPSRASMSWLSQFSTEVGLIKGAKMWVNTSTRTATIILDHPGSLDGGPPGTHELARGWLLHKAVHRIDELINIADEDRAPLEWSSIDLDRSGAIRTTRAGKVVA